MILLLVIRKKVELHVGGIGTEFVLLVEEMQSLNLEMILICLKLKIIQNLSYFHKDGIDIWVLWKKVETYLDSYSVTTNQLVSGNVMAITFINEILICPYYYYTSFKLLAQAIYFV